MNRPKYIKWIVEETGVTLENNTPVKCYRINYKINEEVLDDWALHIRRQYESDEEVLEGSKLNDMSVEDYLRKYIIPQREDDLGPTARASDITEILIADLLEFIFDYTVPRCKQRNRSGKCNSEHGTDVIAYRFSQNDKKPDSRDELIAAEVKAQLTSTNYTAIEKAINDSKKDEHRLARTINYYRKQLRMLGKISDANEITRFLIKSENDYQITYVAAGISSSDQIDRSIKLSIAGDKLIINSNQKVLYVHGKDLMNLTHQIYERCVK